MADASAPARDEAKRTPAAAKRKAVESGKTQQSKRKRDRVPEEYRGILSFKVVGYDPIKKSVRVTNGSNARVANGSSNEVEIKFRTEMKDYDGEGEGCAPGCFASFQETFPVSHEMTYNEISKWKSDNFDALSTVAGPLFAFRTKLKLEPAESNGTDELLAMLDPVRAACLPAAPPSPTGFSAHPSPTTPRRPPKRARRSPSTRGTRPRTCPQSAATRALRDQRKASKSMAPPLTRAASRSRARSAGAATTGSTSRGADRSSVWQVGPKP